MTPDQPRTLRDLAIFVRSKNAGPFMITIDLFFADDAAVQAVLASKVLAPALIAEIYGVDEGEVRLIHLAQANALKVSFPRPLAAGDVSDRDVAGGQQFLPLLGLIVAETRA